MYKTLLLIGLLLLYSLLRWEYGFLLFNVILAMAMILAYLRAKIQYRLDNKPYDLTGNFIYYLGLFVGCSVIVVEFMS